MVTYNKTLTNLIKNGYSEINLSFISKKLSIFCFGLKTLIISVFSVLNKMLKHVTLISDGNRKWAEKRGLSSWQGYLKGAKTVEKILEKFLELKIPYFTLFWGSYDDLTKRPKKEIKFLLKIYERYFKKLLKEKRIEENEVKINVFGKWKEVFPKNLKKVIERVIEKTKNYNRYFLSFLLGYNGTDEMLECAKKIAIISKKRKIKVDENLIKENLWTGDLPPVDLIIRTGCEGNLPNPAGLMMWLTSYSQFCFTKTLFPDFSPKEFEKAIKDFLKRERRFGK